MTNMNTGRVAVGSDPPTLSSSEALTRLYDAHAGGLHRYLARRLDPSTADDLVAETFLVAWEQRTRYEPSRAAHGHGCSASRRTCCAGTPAQRPPPCAP